MEERTLDELGALCRRYLILYTHKHKRREVQEIIIRLYERAGRLIPPETLEVHVADTVQVGDKVR